MSAFSPTRGFPAAPLSPRPLDRQTDIAPELPRLLAPCHGFLEFFFTPVVDAKYVPRMSYSRHTLRNVIILRFRAMYKTEDMQRYLRRSTEDFRHSVNM